MRNVDWWVLSNEAWTKLIDRRHQQRRREANLGILFRDPVKDGSEGAIGITALFSRFGIIFISLGEPLWAKVVGVAEGFVDALHRLPAGHEDLEL